MTVKHDCDECGATVAGADLEGFGDAYIAHVRSAHTDWPFPDVAIRNYAEATQRLTGSTERLPALGPVTVHPVTEDRIGDWLAFFDHDAFAGNPAWAACFCHEPHAAEQGVAPEERPHLSWRDHRQAMIDLLRSG